MPIHPPALDDRSYDDLVAELLSRIPAHTPEWTNPVPGDPGRTIIELFAWLTDTLLYRANLIPERQRLVFLKLLGVNMRSAIAARSIVTVSIDDDKTVAAQTIKPRAIVKGPVEFETCSELNVLPVFGEAYYKKKLCERKKKKISKLVKDLQEFYKIENDAEPYHTTPVFVDGVMDENGFDIVEKAVDRCLWIALLAPSAEQVDSIRKNLGKKTNGGRQVVNIGIMPTIKPADPFDEIGHKVSIPFIWEISSADENNKTAYHQLDIIKDDTKGLIRDGVMQLALPGEQHIGKPSSDVRENINAGVGDVPPRVDDTEKDACIVAWLRLRPHPDIVISSMAVSWVAINAVSIEQLRTISGRLAGRSDGNPDQKFHLPGKSVEDVSLQIQVEAPGRGYLLWQQVGDLFSHDRDDAVYRLDSEAGTIYFGDGMRGKIPERGCRIRIASMRYGGGIAGNLPAGTLSRITAHDMDGNPATHLKMVQSLPTTGGFDAETLDQAEKRIPSLFRHQDRAVTVDDYRHLAEETPGVNVGRVEVMPGFKPQQFEINVPGVISVMALPQKATGALPDPRPDRPFIESIYNYLDKRRLLGTELYVIGCEYVPVGISTSIWIREGFGFDEVINNVRKKMFEFLWPLAPGWIENKGWPLGYPLCDREIEVMVARVPGVMRVNGINLFRKSGDKWKKVLPKINNDPVQIEFKFWQLPELLETAIVGSMAGQTSTGVSGFDKAPESLGPVKNPFASDSVVAVPVVPEVCS